MTGPGQSPRVRKRTVFYVMGFDPRGSPFYYGQLKREARISRRRGHSMMEVGPLTDAWTHGQVCQCKSAAADHDVEISYHFLSISDFVDAYFRLPYLTRLAHAARLFVRSWLSGFLFDLATNTPKFALFTQYPYAVLSLAPMLGVCASLLAAQITPAWVSVIVGLMTAAASLVFILKHEHRFYVMYLLGDFLFSSRALTHPPPPLRQRLIDFTGQVLEALRNSRPDEEVLIVGHSSGALLAIGLAASVVRASPAQSARGFSLLTLGNQASLAYMRGAESFKEDVATLLKAPSIIWRDIFAPQDVISSGRFDFAEKLKIKTIKSNTYIILSARLKEALSTRTYKRLQYSFLKMHMQYLRANETGRGFNYFKVLEAPCRLSEFSF